MIRPETDSDIQGVEHAAHAPVFEVRGLNVYYGDFRAVRDVSLDVVENEITAFIGPSGNATEVRRRIGMVFQKPNPFPKSIFDNVAYGPRLLGTKNKADLADI